MFTFVGDLFAAAGEPVALVSVAVAVVGGLVAFVGEPVAVVSVAVAFVGDLFLVVGESLAPVGFSFAFVGDPVAFISDPFTLVSGAVALIGVAVTQVSDVVAFVGGTRSFVGLDEAQFLQPVTGIGRESTKVRHPAAVFGGAFAFVVGVQSLFSGLTATHGSLTGVRGEELGSFRCPPAQLCGDRACVGGPLPKSRRDSLGSGCLVRFVPPAIVPDRHVFESTRHAWAGLAGAHE
ncbi:hypothetical protein [Actinopolymorpha cephalotaxi]|uniref:Uncharacterized protein n=1 Tax=Actinopolymorpha cephalotaxi TaxID=504797 RepID=A0ABX2SAP8_9ACTN|nr:hypothetical protein [Actinopolymorpha cephalotaxi]NYH86053.1 hypothetical protein [Actinopolymorpha cephalotaxi]